MLLTEKAVREKGTRKNSAPAAEKPPAICLTFDDGPDPIYTPQLLDLLEEWQIPAAFFTVGRQAAANPEILRRMTASGHTIGLHSWSHKSAYLMGPRRTAEDFRLSVEALRAMGIRPAYCRPPWGHTTPAVRKLAAKYELPLIYWDVMAQDWKASIKEDEILRRLLLRTGLGSLQANDPQSGGTRADDSRPGGLRTDSARADGSRPDDSRPGAIVCLHDGRGRRQAPQRMIHALSRAVEIWKAQDFRFLTLKDYLAETEVNHE